MVYTDAVSIENAATDEYVQDKYLHSLTLFGFLYQGFIVLCCPCFRKKQEHSF